MSDPETIEVSTHKRNNVLGHLPHRVVNEILCAKCSALDFSIFESGRDIDVREGVLLADRITADKGGCPLCRFLSTIISQLTNPPSDRPEPINEEYQIRAYSTLLSYHGVTNAELRRNLILQNRVLLGVGREGEPNLENVAFFSSIPQSQEECQREEATSFGCQLVSLNVDFGQLSRWLDFCHSHHKNCEYGHMELNALRNQGKDYLLIEDQRGPVFTDGEAECFPAWPSDLRVIDCENRTIIAPSKHSSYVALSYVWGEPRENEVRIRPRAFFEDGIEIKLPTQVPPTIQDAMEAVKRLGMRFLWVDQYCVPQLDGHSKNIQIQQMHLIYKCAYVTIIAASGSDAYAGLPGVSRPRHPQPRVSLRSRDLISTLAHPHVEVRSSVWHTRGWTYQEGVFSGRRLFWTKGQVYFECNGMNIGEAVSKPLLPLHNLKGETFRSGIRASMFKSPRVSVDRSLKLERCKLNQNRSVESYEVHSRDLSYFHCYLEQYTNRQLRYPSDSLNAFAGILGTFADLGYSISHYWGIPIGKEHTSSFQRNLSWYHSDTDTSTPVRRLDFPSWSWAGWSGAIRFESWKPFKLSDEGRHMSCKWPRFRVKSTHHGDRLHRLRAPKDALRLTRLGERKHTLHVVAQLASVKLVYLSRIEDLQVKGFPLDLTSETHKYLRRRSTEFKPGFHNVSESYGKTLLDRADLSIAAPEGSRQRAILLQKPCIGICLGYNGDERAHLMLIQRTSGCVFERIGHISVFMRPTLITTKVSGVKRTRTGRHILQLV